MFSKDLLNSFIFSRFERKKVESEDDKERIISDKNERGNSSKDEDKVIDAVISEKEGSID